MIAGFIRNMTGNDHSAYMEQCFKDTPQFETDMCDAVNAFATKDNQQMITGLHTVLADLPQLNTFMAACPDAQADYAVMVNWFKYWKGQGEMKVYQTAYTNVMHNMPAIKQDVATLELNWDAHNMYGVGIMAEVIAVLALPLPAAAEILM